MAKRKEKSKRASNRTGRGWLSSIDRLPEDCRPVVDWAAKELAKTDRTQTDILEEFNTKLKAIDPTVEPISKSAFNRHAIRLSIITRRLTMTREITGAMVEQLGADSSDDLTIMAAEAIKTLIFELLADAGEGGLEPIEAMRLATALKQATLAQHISTDRRERILKDFNEKAEEAIEETVRKKGITRDAANSIKAKILGVTDLKG